MRVQYKYGDPTLPRIITIYLDDIDLSAIQDDIILQTELEPQELIIRAVRANVSTKGK